MRTLILALGFIVAALPARAQTIAPAEVKAHVGQTVTVQAAVSDVHIGRAGVTFIDIGGTYPNNDFAAVIFASDRTKFPNASDLKGKTVAISGPVVLYQNRPEIILKTADQLKAN
jgi:DNA/RNA endonuclease YhcR with UshA esterase domain